MFPGYILVEMIMTDEAWYVVRNTPGVTGFNKANIKSIKSCNFRVDISFDILLLQL